VCVPALIDAAKLLEFEPTLFDGKGSNCFRLTKKAGEVLPACMDAAVTPKLIDSKACIFEAPDPLGLKGLNVEAHYDGGVVREVLDLDEEEGFTMEAGKPRQFRLAPGLCQAWRAGHGYIAPTTANQKLIGTLQVSASCAPKTTSQPICAPDQEAINYPANANPNKLVTLTPVPGTMMLVLDASKENKEAFGGLAQKFLEVVLKNPMTDRLKVGLVTSSSCTPAPAIIASKPEELEKVADAIQSLIKMKDALPDSVGLDPALKAAYAALADEMGSKAVFVLGNKAFAQSCSTPTAAKDLATDSKIATYTAKTGAPDEGNRTAAKALATPTEKDYFVDATTDEAILGKFASVSAELGSGVYTAPASLAAKAQLSYFNPNTREVVKVEYTAACAGGGLGYSQSGSTITFCEGSRKALVDALSQAGLTALATGGSLPQIDVIGESK
jgi:hypothetical protein